MIKMLIRTYYNYRRRTERRSATEYFCFLINNPRMVCRIMSMMILVILSSLSTDCVLQMLNVKQINLKNNDFSDPGSHIDMEAELLQINTSLNNFDKIMRIFMYHLGYVSIFIFTNVLLLKATYRRNLQSIKIWLFVHISHMTYSLSLNVCIGIIKDSYVLIILTLFNTILYLLSIMMVILFWMNERYLCCVLETAAALRQQRIMVL